MSPAELTRTLERYFAGDLDRVERRDLDRAFTEDPALRETFDLAYDARTEESGLLALASASADLSECFAPATLEAFVAGELDEEARAWVENHLDCPLCRAEVDGLRRVGSNLVETPPKPANDPGSVRGRWGRRGLLLTGLAAAAVILLWPKPPPRYRGPGAFGETLSVRLALPRLDRVTARSEGLEVARAARPEVVLTRADGTASVYYAIGTSTSAAGPVTWAYPTRTPVGLLPDLSALPTQAEARFDVELPKAGMLWLVLADRPQSLEIVQGRLRNQPGEGPWDLPLPGRAVAARWQLGEP